MEFPLYYPSINNINPISSNNHTTSSNNNHITFVPLNKQYPNPFVTSSQSPNNDSPSQVSLYYLSYLFDVNQDRSLFYQYSCFSLFKSFSLLLCDLILSEEDASRPIVNRTDSYLLDFSYAPWKKTRKYENLRTVKIRSVSETELSRKEKMKQGNTREIASDRNTKKAMISFRKPVIVNSNIEKSKPMIVDSNTEKSKPIQVKDEPKKAKCLFNKSSDGAYQQSLKNNVIENCTLHFNNTRDVLSYDQLTTKYKIMSYYNKKYCSGSGAYSSTFVDDSARYGHHIQRLICNKFREAGIQVFDPVRVICDNFTSTPDGLLYILNFTSFNANLNMVPLEIKSTYSTLEESNCLINEGISISHLFQMLTHCYVHNSEICIYFYYHRITGSHKIMMIYDKDHQYWKQITRIMKLSKNIERKQLMELVSEQCEECSSVISSEIKSLVLSIIKKRRQIKNIHKSRYRCESYNNMINTKEMEEMILGDMQQLSFSCVKPIYYHNNISNSTHFFKDQWSEHLSPPYNTQEFWRRLSKHFI